jgi:transcription elongation factor GreA
MPKQEKMQLTPEGLEKLKQELEYRKNVKKKKLSEILGSAIEKGDLSENEEYSIALEDTLANDARIKELTDTIKNSTVIKKKKGKKTVGIGSSVTIKDKNGTEKIFHIVSEVEANPMEKKVSNTSPIGKGLVGKAINNKVHINAPNGSEDYTITKIE